VSTAPDALEGEDVGRDHRRLAGPATLLRERIRPRDELRPERCRAGFAGGEPGLARSRAARAEARGIRALRWSAGAGETSRGSAAGISRARDVAAPRDRRREQLDR